MVTSSKSAQACAGEPATGVVVQDLELDRLYEEHFAFVWRSLLRLGVREENADDAVQDVFLVVHRRVGEFEGRANIKTWLFSVAARVAHGYKRRQRRQFWQEPVPLSLADARSCPELRTESARAAEFLDAFLDGLEDGKRAVFVMMELEQMTAPEAAEALGIKVNTVYSRLRSVRVAFREAALASGRLGGS
jgi:RNA polymerase sigma-70 factor (ECF subfamily)